MQRFVTGIADWYQPFDRFFSNILLRIFLVVDLCCRCSAINATSIVSFVHHISFSAPFFWLKILVTVVISATLAFNAEDQARNDDGAKQNECQDENLIVHKTVSIVFLDSWNSRGISYAFLICKVTLLTYFPDANQQDKVEVWGSRFKVQGPVR